MNTRIPLLLHACCAPCSLEPLRLLREEGFEPVICWTNPNIQPVAEHDHRLETLLGWASDVAKVEVIVAADNREAWERTVAPLWENREKRCAACYALRLAEAARVANERGFTHISTTLAVSPYQLYGACMRALEVVAAKQGLIAVVRDFRPNYPDATRAARELGLYRQNYCGCRFSAAEAAMERQAARDERKAAKKHASPEEAKPHAD